MNINYKYLFYILFLSSLLCLHAKAPESNSQVTLDEIFAQFDQYDPGVKIENLKAKEFSLQATQASKKWNPQFDFDSFLSTSRSTILLRVSQLVWDSGLVSGTESMLEADSKISKLSSFLLAQESKTELAELYFKIISGKQALVFYTDLQSRVEQFFKKVKKARKVRILGKVDYEQFKIFRLSFLQKEAVVKARLTQQVQELSLKTGKKYTTDQFPSRIDRDLLKQTKISKFKDEIPYQNSNSNKMKKLLLEKVNALQKVEDAKSDLKIALVADGGLAGESSEQVVYDPIQGPDVIGQVALRITYPIYEGGISSYRDERYKILKKVSKLESKMIRQKEATVFIELLSEINSNQNNIYLIKNQIRKTERLLEMMNKQQRAGVILTIQWSALIEEYGNLYTKLIESEATIAVAKTWLRILSSKL